MRIVKVRLSGEQDDIRVIAELISRIPGVSADGLDMKANYRNPGYRGYLTVVYPGKDHENNSPLPAIDP